jgi:PTH1 family peptidyl-tRNA hydrolase
MASYYKIPPEQILVAYDDLDLELGRAQLKFDGGHGGHNGIRDIVQNIGKAFWRLRLGVGHPGQGHRDKVLSHLLRPASSVDEDEILDAIDAAIEVLPVFIEKGAERAKTQLHSRGVEPRAYKKGGDAGPGES